MIQNKSCNLTMWGKIKDQIFFYKCQIQSIPKKDIREMAIHNSSKPDYFLIDLFMWSMWVTMTILKCWSIIHPSHLWPTAAVIPVIITGHLVITKWGGYSTFNIPRAERYSATMRMLNVLWSPYFGIFAQIG